MNKIITVSLRDQRISPKKARLVISFVKGMRADAAISALQHLKKKGAREVSRLLKSAIDGAKDKDYKAENLYISESICQEGRKLKRFTVLARGRSTQFRKRMSHLKISLSKLEEKTEETKAPRAKGGGKAEKIKQTEIVDKSNNKTQKKG